MLGNKLGIEPELDSVAQNVGVRGVRGNCGKPCRDPSTMQRCEGTGLTSAGSRQGLSYGEKVRSHITGRASKQ